jgi:hypothetical protein
VERWSPGVLRAALVLFSVGSASIAWAQAPVSADAGTAKPSPPPDLGDDGAARHGLQDVENAFKEGKFLKYGFTAGAAGVAFFDVGRRQYLGTGTLSYLAAFPFWWQNLGSITRVYCAARSEREDAQAVADSLAIQKTLDWLHEQSEQATLPQQGAFASAIAEVQRLRKRLPLPQGDPDRTPMASNAAFIVKSVSGWDLRLQGKCSPLLRFGIYVGIPSGFTASAQPASADFSPLLSFGVAVIPYWSSLSILVGPAVSHVTNDSGSVVTAWSLALSVGGNLDLLGRLVGGK